MSRSMHCNHCGAYVGDCGHEPGMTTPVTLSGTCQCGWEFSVTCNGSCISAEDKEGTRTNLECKTCHGTGTIVVDVKYECATCDGTGNVLDQTCTTCHGSGKMTVKEERNCPKCNS